MSTLTEEAIRIRAYVLWEAAGQPHGQSSMDVFWYEAEKQLLAENAEQDHRLNGTSLPSADSGETRPLESPADILKRMSDPPH